MRDGLIPEGFQFLAMLPYEEPRFRAARLAALTCTLAGDELRAAVAARQPMNRSTGVTAVIPIRGFLAQHAGMIDELFGIQSVATLCQAFQAAVDDNRVRSIVLDIDSPGGEVLGMEEFASCIFAARGPKPITAVANSMMASAAYWIGSAADELVATPSAQVGSIGVYGVYMDETQALEKMGVKATIVRTAPFKGEGTGLEPMSDEAMQHQLAIAQGYHDMFVAAVARGRATTPANVTANYGQGRVVTAKQAVQLGMADRVATLDTVLGRHGGASNASMPGQMPPPNDNCDPQAQARVARLAAIAMNHHPSSREVAGTTTGG